MAKSVCFSRSLDIAMACDDMEHEIHESRSQTYIRIILFNIYGSQCAHALNVIQPYGPFFTSIHLWIYHLQTHTANVCAMENLGKEIDETVSDYACSVLH